MNAGTKHIIFVEAERQFGRMAQVIKAAEEFSEASAVMCRYANGQSLVSEHDIITELADAEIMSEQMRLYFSGELIDAEKLRKMERLAQRLGVVEIK